MISFLRHYCRSEFKRIFIVLSLPLAVCLLQGCLPVAFVAGAATAGIVVFDNRAAKTMVDDRDITFRLQSRLNGDPELGSVAHLSVTSFNRVVLLVGQVPSDILRQRAEDMVRSNPKVRIVYNEITVVEKPSGLMTRTNDSWITTKVKTILAATSRLNSTSLKIVTEKGVVYLMGLTTKGQGSIAADKARTVFGVNKVVKLFEYIN